jgi:hypothetical protein
VQREAMWNVEVPEAFKVNPGPESVSLKLKA